MEGSPERLGAFTPAHLCRFAVRSLRLRRLEVLSRQCGFARFGASAPPRQFSGLTRARICLRPPPTTLARLYHRPGRAILLRHPRRSTGVARDC